MGAYLRLHHAFADGAAALAAFGALLDQAADAPTPAAPPWTPAPIPAASELLADNLRRRRAELGRGWPGLTHPGQDAAPGATGLAGVAGSPRRAARPADQPQPPGRRRPPAGPHPQPPGPLKQIAHAHHATVNDVVLAAVAGGLRQLLASRGEDVRGLVQRAMVTISLHQEQPGQARGNKPGWMMVPLPLGEPDPVRRLS